jgi:hypothetical protein
VCKITLSLVSNPGIGRHLLLPPNILPPFPQKQLPFAKFYCYVKREIGKKGHQERAYQKFEREKSGKESEKGK